MPAARQPGTPGQAAVAEPVAALILELPQRDLGGQQPSWEDLHAQLEWGRGRGAEIRDIVAALTAAPQ
ncbi:MAG TPA: hypothetical protein VKD26_13675 [Streptosporangiaceae bacterium]|nr:hypothetical protein [Streptosporangiaceae bacterium]